MQMIIINTAIIISTAVFMEAFATISHKYVMHGCEWGWSWHQTHHLPRPGWFEQNDLYAVFFVILSISAIYLGVFADLWPLQWIGIGVTLYGMLYFIVHDGLVHKRWPFHYVPRTGYLNRLYMAHRLHHAVKDRDGSVSFGFLYAPPLSALSAEFRHNRLLKQKNENQ
eukprot:TRINITY_DN10335_c0_g1_i1.p1 TRINITY_DN10335_c0_g1~~TRINITY_DN10335_c0_g1_i1.p1  ORF type:complete len:168 (+),score=11.83 TRINITY_DN10335_c0_g1_i1:114-617(+)